MKIEIEAIESWAEWDKTIVPWESSSVYHTSGWLKALEETSGRRCIRIVASENGERVAALPMFKMRVGPLKGILSPPPSAGVEYLGPVLEGGLLSARSRELDRLRILQEMLREIEEEHGPSLTYVRASPWIGDGRAFTWQNYRLQTLYTYVVDLRGGLGPLIEGFHHSLRRDIKRCEGKVEVRQGNRELCAVAHDFISSRFAAQGLKFGPTRRYLTRLFENLGSAVFEPIGAYASDVLEAVAIITYHGERASFWQHASRAGATALPFTSCLAWHAIALAAERGCSEFEIVGANTPRLVEYKSKFRPRLEPFLEASKASFSGRSAMVLYQKLRS